ncbi:MAG: MnmC family methyltransferase [Candidatus Caenarcaniphilales bacterium]|nr:MnmC family methyltransferase [Candidatus Caenarcaniphilales bacterium]
MIEFVKTKDGSPTIYDPETGEHHHSLIGSYTEARYKFAEVARSIIQKKSRINLLDLPFGLGYNLIATLDVLREVENTSKKDNGNSVKQKFLECVAVEKDRKVIEAIGYYPWQEPLKGKFVQLKNVLNEGNQIEAKDFSLNLIIDDLLLVLPKIHQSFDLIFYDPFSPKTSPDLWSREKVLKFFYELLAPGGLLITYTASNKVRKGLQEVGFYIAPSVAVGRKMPGTIASKEPLEASFSEETFEKIQKASSY